MSVTQAENGTWEVSVWYKDWQGERKRKHKRGFATKREAKAWENAFVARQDGSPDMRMHDFYELYREDRMPHLKLNTWRTKEQIIETKILPFFGEMKLCDIMPADILSWQNAIQDERTSNGPHYRDSYPRSISNQLSAMLNHAVRYYNLPSNPMSKVDRMGSKKTEEMKFWTKEEYKAFSHEIMDKDASFLLFELLYWLGIRSGEALALMPQDFDFERNRVSITKTYVRLNGKDVFNPPKTKKSVRAIAMPQFLTDEVQDYLIAHPLIKPDDKLTNATKSFLAHEMERGCKQAGVKRIRIHDLRHSHVSLLIEMGFSAPAIAERLGHESTEVTMMYAHLFPNKQEEMAKRLAIERGPMAATLFEEARAMKEANDECEEHR